MPRKPKPPTDATLTAFATTLKSASPTLRLTQDQYAAIRQGITLGLWEEMIPYLGGVYTGPQLREIFEVLAMGADVSTIINPALDCRQMHEIVIGLRAGIDVAVYAHSRYGYNHMSWIRRALVREMPVEAHPAFFESAYRAMVQYNILDNQSRQNIDETYKIQVRRIKVETYEMEAQCKDKASLIRAIEAVNVQEVDKIRDVRSKCREYDVLLPEKIQGTLKNKEESIVLSLEGEG